MADTATAKRGIEEYSDEEKLLDKIRKRAQIAWDKDRENREEALLDLRFAAGDQWPESIRKEREDAGRPCLTLDKIGQHRNQVVNDIRMAKISIKAVGVDGNTDPKLAETYTGLLRDIQYHSYAQHVFAEAGNGAVTCGIGHFRLLTDYVDDSVFDQEILIKQIPYPLAVMWDPAAVEPDRSDADYCFVLDFIPMSTFEERWPNARPTDLEVPRDVSVVGGLLWGTKDGVLTAEYWERRPVKKTLAQLVDGTTIYLDDAEMPPAVPVEATREVETYEAVQWLVAGDQILDGPNVFPSKYIPIIPVIGSEIHLETHSVREGLIRKARDPQQLYNYWRSSAAELIALAPKAKWLVTPTQIGEFKHEWDEAHLSPTPYLRFKPDPQAPSGEPKLIAPPAPPAALWQEAALVADDIKSATGIYDAGLGARGNETSGIAIQRRQQEGDVATYHFSDNLARSLKHCGKVLIDMIPKVYDTPRVLRLMGEDDTFDYKPVNTQMPDPETGETVLLNDLSAGRFDVRISIGPSYTTQRLEAADAMLEYGKIDPSAMPLIRDLFVRSMDWPGKDEIADRLKRTIPPQVLAEDGAGEPSPDEQAKMQAEQQARELEQRMMGAKISKEEGDARKRHAEADKLEQQIPAEGDRAFGESLKTQAEAGKSAEELRTMKTLLDTYHGFPNSIPSDERY